MAASRLSTKRVHSYYQQTWFTCDHPAMLDRPVQRASRILRTTQYRNNCVMRKYFYYETMLNTSFKETLEHLGLKQAEFARLIEMSPRSVSLWATGESPLPGPVAAYLRVLQLLPAEVRAQELRRVQGRSKMIDEGLYNVEYRFTGSHSVDADVGSALAVLRNGKILGSDRWGAVFMGSYEFDPVNETNAVHLRLHVPPQGELVTGFAAGPEGAIIEVAGQFERAAPLTRTIADIAGQPLEVTMTYLGALPN